MLLINYNSATGNDSFGYWSGGHFLIHMYQILIVIDYANDTATASPKGNLTD